MVHLVGKAHCFDRETLARLNAAIVLGLVGTGLGACMLGAVVYDVYDIGRSFSFW